MRVMGETEKVLGLILGWKSRKELEKAERDPRLWVEEKLVESHPKF